MASLSARLSAMVANAQWSSVRPEIIFKSFMTSYKQDEADCRSHDWRKNYTYSIYSMSFVLGQRALIEAGLRLLILKMRSSVAAAMTQQLNGAKLMAQLCVWSSPVVPVTMQSWLSSHRISVWSYIRCHSVILESDPHFWSEIIYS